jgi:hypothetical protein
MRMLLGEANINWYVANTVLLLFVLVLLAMEYFAKKHVVPQIVETPMTLHDREKANALRRMCCRMVYALFLPLLILNTVLMLTDRKGEYAFFVTILIALSIIAYFIALVVYTDILERRWVSELTKKGISIPQHKHSFSDLSKRTSARAIAVLVAFLSLFYILEHILRFHR